jgi:two-component system, LytTR family, response regulator
MPTAMALRTEAKRESGPVERVLIRDGSKVHVLPVNDIDFVQAQDDYVCFHSGGREFLKEQPLAEVEQTLDAARFVRVHRSYLLNVDRLARVEPLTKDSRIAILKDGRRLPLSRAGYQRLNALL